MIFEFASVGFSDGQRSTSFASEVDAGDEEQLLDSLHFPSQAAVDENRLAVERLAASHIAMPGQRSGSIVVDI